MRAIVEWAPREFNKEADQLANGISDSFDPNRRLHVSSQTLTWNILPTALQAGRDAEQAFRDMKERYGLPDRCKKQTKAQGRDEIEDYRSVVKDGDNVKRGWCQCSRFVPYPRFFTRSHSCLSYRFFVSIQPISVVQVTILDLYMFLLFWVLQISLPVSVSVLFYFLHIYRAFSGAFLYLYPILFLLHILVGRQVRTNPPSWSLIKRLIRVLCRTHFPS